jgi:hypothetical protein
MNDQTYLANTRTTSKNSLATTEAQAILNLGRQGGWDAFVLGNAPLPGDPVRVDDWLVVPAQQDSTPIPSRALERIESIYTAGIRPQGFVLVHEAPLRLPANVGEDHGTVRISHIPPKTRQLAKTVAVAGALTLGGLVILPGLIAFTIAVIGLAMAVIVPLGLLAGAAAVDPILVAVTEDGDWVEIDRWWNE